MFYKCKVFSLYTMYSIKFAYEGLQNFLNKKQCPNFFIFEGLYVYSFYISLYTINVMIYYNI